jgi:branched-chain amino acid transport system ATP-binding protein
MEALRVEGLSKNFGGVYAVNDVTISVKVGERLAIIGPNGAGKTTLFNLINGQLSATAGRIYFFGEDVTDLPTHVRAHLGQARAFQIISLLQKLTVLDNALLTLHGTRPSRFKMFRPVLEFQEVFGRAAETLKNLDLWEMKDDPVANLGYGEQRRLEIGLGLAMQPRLLLLDEPSAGLSKEEGAEVVQIIQNLEPDITVLIVDHDMEMIFGAAERVIVLHYGEIIADGTPTEIEADQRVREIYMGIQEESQHAGVSRNSHLLWGKSRPPWYLHGCSGRDCCRPLGPQRHGKNDNHPFHHWIHPTKIGCGAVQRKRHYPSQTSRDCPHGYRAHPTRPKYFPIPECQRESNDGSQVQAQCGGLDFG